MACGGTIDLGTPLHRTMRERRECDGGHSPCISAGRRCSGRRPMFRFGRPRLWITPVRCVSKPG